MGADRGRLRRLVHRPGIRLRLLPELEQQRARDGRVHARGRSTIATGTLHAVLDRHSHRENDEGARSDAPHGRAAWQCGDPGMQFDTTINDWHTSATTGRIYASNPCSEYMFLNDTACNLASINLMTLPQATDGSSSTSTRIATRSDITITAQEIIVDNASYPTEKIAHNSERLPSARPRLRQPRRAADVARPAVRHDAGRDLRRGLTAIMTGEAYAQSARMAARGRAVHRLSDATASRCCA